MTKSDQIKILNDKIKANNAQYDINRLNAEISAHSSGDLNKYEFLTKQDLKCKPNAREQAKFAYSPLGKVFNDGLNKKDKTKKVGILQRLKNIEDNLNSNDDNDDNGNRKVGIFQIIKGIKGKGIKISNDDEAIREIREHIQNLRNEGIEVNNFDEISREIKDHIQNLKVEGIDVNINDYQVKYLLDEIFKGIGKRDLNLEDSISEDSILAPQDLESFFKKYENENINAFYKDFGKRYDIGTYEINNDIKDYIDGIILKYDFSQKYNTFINKFNKIESTQEKKKRGAIGPEQKKLLEYRKNLRKIIEKISSGSSGSQ